jgi:hypothetical protein
MIMRLRPNLVADHEHRRTEPNVEPRYRLNTGRWFALRAISGLTEHQHVAVLVACHQAVLDQCCRSKLPDQEQAADE